MQKGEATSCSDFDDTSSKNAGMLETLWACGHHHGISWDTWDFHCFAGFLPTVGCGLSRFFFSRAPKLGPV